jgi:hypothetical protein
MKKIEYMKRKKNNKIWKLNSNIEELKVNERRDALVLVYFLMFLV